jgi:single-stranded-DNA-specific exonuclease
MTRPWLPPSDILVPVALAATVGGHPLVAQTLARRGVTTPAAAVAFLDPDAYIPTPPETLPGMARSVNRLWRAIRGGEPIGVWGDFDVDGQTATALLVATLTDLGAHVSYHVPMRETASHGVDLPNLKQVIANGARLILTCDTGVTAHEAASYARGQGVDMIITDHHELGASLPDATAVINPKLLPSREHPLADLPGVGVAYKLAEALYERARRPGDAARHLDLVALGIVADLAIQRGDTRYLLQRGLAALRRSERQGLVALMEKAELDPTWLSEEHIGFVLGPRLNAAGRLADANACVDLLTTDDIGRARILAADLEALNARRKLLCSQVEQGAETQIARDPSLLEGGALVLANPAWPAGIIGIVASRLVERYGKPTILISSPPGEVARASARSVTGVNITAALAAHADLLVNFGGHPMAAGFGIDPERIPDLRRALSRTTAAMLADAHVETGLRIDGFLPLAELTPALVDDLGRLAPFGPGNPPLTLAAERLRARRGKKVGRNDEHQLVMVTDEAGAERQVIWWDGGGEPLPEGRFDLAYVARNSTYRGMRELQVEWVAARPSAGSEVEAKVKAKAEIEVVDYRKVLQPREALAGLIEQGNVAVWREGEGTGDIPGYDRRNLPRASTLAIWTAPPGPAELRAALAQSGPARVCLFARDPDADTPEAFIRRLTGLAKHALNARASRAPIVALAAATAQRESTVRLGLAWLAARGHIRIAGDTGGEVELAPGDGLNAREADLRLADARLQAALAETAAYRAYFREADAGTLVRR